GLNSPLKKIGYKEVISPKTERKIQSLKDNLIRKTQMTEADFARIVQKEVGARPPKYVNAKRFITEKEGKSLIRRMLDEAEIIKETQGFNQAIKKNPKIAEQVKTIDKKITDRRNKGVRDPWRLESMRYYLQGAELKSGAPFFTMYQSLIDTHAEIVRQRQKKWEQLKETQGYKASARNEKSLKRVSDYIASQSKLVGKPSVPKNITPDEINLAKEIQKILKDYEFKCRAAKFFNWYYFNEPIPDADRYKAEITK
ncbi:unnamed protein product, partial [marine sediment metagenome]